MRHVSVVLAVVAALLLIFFALTALARPATSLPASIDPGGVAVGNAHLPASRPAS